MKIGEIMVKNVKCVCPGDTIKDVVVFICTNHISGVPVVEDGRVIGIISEKDVLKAMYPDYVEFYYDTLRSKDFEEIELRYNDLIARKAEDIMTRNVVTTTPATPILKASSLMILKKIRRLPVVDEGKMVGIVSLGDIHQSIFRRKLIR